MTQHDELRLSLGSYLIGALGPATRLEVGDHLKRCETCRAELVELAALPGLLGRLGAQQLGSQLGFSACGTASAASSLSGTMPDSPPEGLLDEMLDRARRIEDRSRRRLRRLRAAAIVAAAAAIVATALALAPAVASRPGTSYRLHAEIPSTSLAGKVTLVPKPWGTELALSLQGLPPRVACEAVVTGTHGQRAAIGNWSATQDHAARVEIASDMSPSQLASLTIETVAGSPLLGVTLPRFGS
ncbi:MAG: hypothetical protein M0010_23125 [Actinomycetota bacterium]|nr:hypothetical protein [Actinomycetota bacterium]